MHCKYSSGKCDNERTYKANGQRHTLCEMHRQKSCKNQRIVDKKKKYRKNLVPYIKQFRSYRVSCNNRLHKVSPKTSPLKQPSVVKHSATKIHPSFDEGELRIMHAVVQSNSSWDGESSENESDFFQECNQIFDEDTITLHPEITPPMMTLISTIYNDLLREDDEMFEHLTSEIKDKNFQNQNEDHIHISH